MSNFIFNEYTDIFLYTYITKAFVLLLQTWCLHLLYILCLCICSLKQFFLNPNINCTKKKLRATFYINHQDGNIKHVFYIYFAYECPDCKKYSLNSTGPWMNGGKVYCRVEEVTPEITCQCLPNYGGTFCEIKIENEQ